MRTPKPINLSEADIARFWSEVDKRGPNDCWEWTAGRDGDGYGTFHDCYGVSHRTSRVAFVISKGNTEQWVLHTCDNRACCNLAHLYAGSPGDNARDRSDRGRNGDVCGSKHGQSKLTEDDVCELRRLRREGWSQRSLAERFCISRGNVANICIGKFWKHVL